MPDDYEYENQMDLEEYLWGIGYYLPVPVENEGDVNAEDVSIQRG